MKDKAVNPTVAKVFHDIRNTYSAFYVFLDTFDDEDPVFTKEQMVEYLDRDVKLMREAETACKECSGGK